MADTPKYCVQSEVARYKSLCLLFLLWVFIIIIILCMQDPVILLFTVSVRIFDIFKYLPVCFF